ncbi:MAG: SEC59/DGK1/VTE5 family protein [Ignavibacteria bacterium]|nr:SEC59/DGK1/VTE5 family protein [Ignavibacteria bacterium]
MTHIDRGTIDYKDELVRKLIHLTSMLIPIIYYFIPKLDALVVLGSLVIFAITLDLSRYFSPQIAKVFYKIFGFLLRKHEVDKEKKNLNGATYILISAFIGVFIFPKVIFITAFSILIIGDSMAALIGRKYGKNKFLFKSLEGTLTFFISSCIVVLFVPKVRYFQEEYLFGFIVAFIGAITENISYKFVDDNLSIPFAVGFSLWILYVIFLSNLELTLLQVPG